MSPTGLPASLQAYPPRSVLYTAAALRSFWELEHITPLLRKLLRLLLSHRIKALQWIWQRRPSRGPQGPLQSSCLPQSLTLCSHTGPLSAVSWTHQTCSCPRTFALSLCLEFSSPCVLLASFLTKFSLNSGLTFQWILPRHPTKHPSCHPISNPNMPFVHHHFSLLHVSYSALYIYFYHCTACEASFCTYIQL